MVNVIKEGQKTGHYISGRFVIHHEFNLLKMNSQLITIE
jgi:hypothetical protein